ncbi:MAG: hypothetical protein ACYDEQ_06335, partial [Desulfocucumaceae bacterium]
IVAQRFSVILSGLYNIQTVVYGLRTIVPVYFSFNNQNTVPTPVNTKIITTYRLLLPLAQSTNYNSNNRLTTT